MTERELDWEKVVDKLKSEARQDVYAAEQSLRRARARLALLDAIGTHISAPVPSRTGENP